MWPTIYNEESNKVYDLPSRLLKDRIVLLTQEISDEVATSIVAQLLYLDSLNKEAPITLYINSPGGSVTAGFAIYDTMQNIKAPVITYCIGMAASMAAFILCSGNKGMRYASENSTILIHQPSGGIKGQATEIAIVAQRILELRKKLYELLCKHTGQDLVTIAKGCERDTYLNPQAALELGIIDKVIQPVK